MQFTRIHVTDTPKGVGRPFLEGAEVKASSSGAAWDESILVEYLRLPPGEMFQCYSSGYTLVQHIKPNSVERLDNSRHLERLDVGPHVIQIDPPGTLLGARWESPQDVLIIIPREVTFQRVLLETYGGRTPNFVRGSSVCDPQIAQIGLSLLAEIEGGLSSGRLFGESLAVALVARLLTCYAEAGSEFISYEGGMQRWRLKRTLEFINDNLGDDLPLSELANVAGLSLYYFCRLFKESTGLAPHKYIVTQRIERAKELLRNTKLGISVISAQLGFADQTHLAVAFRKSTQMTPTEFRFRV